MRKKVLGFFNSKYSSAGYPDLPGVHGDIALWHNIAASRDWEFDVYQNATLNSIYEEDLSEYDLVVFSGHGVRMRRNGVVAEGLAFVENHKLSVLWDVDTPQLKNAEGTVFWIDSCHSGGLADRHELPPFGVTRSMMRLGQVRSLGEIAPGECVNVPTTTRTLVRALNVVTSARDNELATEIFVNDKPYGLATFALKHVLESPVDVLDQRTLMERMQAFGGRRSSQPAGNSWDEFRDLLREVETDGHLSVSV